MSQLQDRAENRPPKAGSGEVRQRSRQGPWEEAGGGRGGGSGRTVEAGAEGGRTGQGRSRLCTEPLAGVSAGGALSFTLSFTEEGYVNLVPETRPVFQPPR